MNSTATHSTGGNTNPSLGNNGSIPAVSSSHTITVSVLDAKIPPTTAKPTAQTSYVVSYQFYDVIEVDESPAFENSRDTPINYSKNFDIKPTDEFMDSLVRRPLRFSLYECIPSGRTLLGTAELSIDSFISTNETVIDGWYQIKLEEGVSVADALSLHISVKLSEPLLTDEQRAQVNILYVQLDGMYSLPPRWTIKDGQDLQNHPFIYGVKCGVPLSEESETHMLYVKGTIAKGAPDGGANAQAEIDPLLSEQEQQWSKIEKYGDRVSWNHTQKLFISSSFSKTFIQLIDSKNANVEFRRLLVDPTDPDPNAKKYHASAQLPISKLTTPGVSSIALRCPVGAYVGTDPADVPFDIRTPSPKSQEKGAKQNAAAKSALPKKAAKKKRPELDPEEDEAVNPFEAAGTYLLFHVSTIHPLVEKVKKKRNLLKPADLIPPRTAYGPSEPIRSATEEFQRVVRGIAESLSEDFYNLFSSELPSLAKDPSAREKFIFELNSSGKYLVFKEKVRRAVVSVVKERFSKKPQSTRKDFEQFYNKLYVYLMEQMHYSINKMMDDYGAEGDENRDGENLTPPSSIDGLLRLSEEAELDDNLELAGKLHLERIALNKEDAQLWFQYGEFLLRTNDKMKAEDVLRECIARDNKFAPALVAYGSSLMSRNNLDHAEVYLRGAVEVDAVNPSYWHILTILYEKMDYDEELKNAQKQMRQLLADEAGTEQKKPSVFSRTARLLLSINNTALLEPILLHDASTSGRSADICIMLGKMYGLKEDFQKAEECYLEATTVSPKNIDAKIELGHVQFKQQKFDEARASYEAVLSMEQNSKRLDVMSRLAKIYSLQGLYEDAKDLFLNCCQISPTSLSWLGAGAALYRMELYEDAEVALSEANILDNRNPDTWCLLTLLSLKTGRDSEADRCMRQALRFNPSNALYLRELGVLYSARGKLEVSETCLRRSLEIEDTEETRISLADALVSKNDAELVDEAAMHYEWVLQHSENEEIKQRAHSGLQSISTRVR